MRTDRRVLKCAILSLITLTFSLASHAAPNAWSDDATPMQQIQGRCDKAAQLIMKKDLAGFSEIIAPDALFFGKGKMRRFQEWKQDLSRELVSMQNLRTSLHVEKCAISGKTAVAHVVKHDDYTSAGDMGHRFHAVEEITLTLTKSNKGWITTQVDFNSRTLVRDGKKYAPKLESRHQDNKGKGAG